MILKQNDIKGIEIFLEKFKIKKKENSLNFVNEILSKVKNLPYENMTKITYSEEKDINKRLRTPFYIVKDFFEEGAGGTCFSLVYFLKSIFDYLGFNSKFLLADRNYGENTHCALILNLENKQYLIDIGYSIYEPIEIKDKKTFKNPAYEFLMEDKEKFIFVYTITKNKNLKFRYKIKKEEVSFEKFLDAWEKSFYFEMMNYIVVTKVKEDCLIYLRDKNFHIIKDGKTYYKKIEEDEIPLILKELGLKENLFLKAKSFLK
jgi:arylamine N-acetyltransferase